MTTLSRQATLIEVLTTLAAVGVDAFMDLEGLADHAEILACGQHLAKGRTVLVQGRISVEDWTDKDGAKRRSWSLLANTVQFVGGKPASAGSAPPAGGGNDAPPAADGFIDDDLPF